MDNKKNIDFNCDLALTDASEQDKAFELADYVSSVNIACALHSGCPLSMKKAIDNCKFKNKVIGALIGLPETVKEPLELSEEEIEAIVLYQLGAISAFAKAYSLNIEHVRTHGEMYKLAAENLEFSIKIAKAVKKYSKWLVLYGAMGEVLKQTVEAVNIRCAAEFVIENEESVSKLEEMIALDNIPDTLHFSVETADVIELLKKTSQLVHPRPVNYNRAALSGWVE